MAPPANNLIVLGTSTRSFKIKICATLITILRYLEAKFDYDYFIIFLYCKNFPVGEPYKGAGGSLTLCQTKEKVGLNNTSNDTRNLQTTFFVPLTSELDGRMVFVMVH